MTASERSSANGRLLPWFQLAIGIVCMAMIANLQYGWTLFVEPIDSKLHWGRTAIQFAFTIFVLTETWLVPIEAWFVDRYGPRLVVMFGGAMIALAWILNAIATSIVVLYLAAVIAGIGAGAIYGTCVGNALKWFPGRRGLAAGATAAGFGAGAAITVLPIAAMIGSRGYETTFLTFGIGQGAIVFVLALLLRAPVGALPAPRKNPKLLLNKVDFAPMQVLGQPIFWMLYLVFVLVASGGLMVAAQIAPIAHDFGIADAPISLFGLQMVAATFAIALDRAFDGFGRPFFGWVSDNIGRENTMFIAFTIAALMLFALANWGHHPAVFVLTTAIYFGAFGEIYSLFPATCGDTFGSKFATTNASMLYTAKGVAALVVPLTSLLAGRFGWHFVFFAGMCLNAAAAALALLVVKPLRRAFILNHKETAPSERPYGAPNFAFAATAHSQPDEDNRDALDTLSPSR